MSRYGGTSQLLRATDRSDLYILKVWQYALVVEYGSVLLTLSAYLLPCLFTNHGGVQRGSRHHW
jgi:hypothetical protein